MIYFALDHDRVTLFPYISIPQYLFEKSRNSPRTLLTNKGGFINHGNREMLGICSVVKDLEDARGETEVLDAV